MRAQGDTVVLAGRVGSRAERLLRPHNRRPMAEPLIGFLHIFRVDVLVDPVQATYRVAFASLEGRLRSRHVICDGLEGLTGFLRRARVSAREIERTWMALARRRVYSVSHVALTPTELETLGL